MYCSTGERGWGRVGCGLCDFLMGIDFLGIGDVMLYDDWGIG